MRHLLLITLALFIFSCGSDPDPDTAEAETTDSVAVDPLAAPDRMISPRGLEPAKTGENDPMTAIREDYARIQAALEAGELLKDSIPYLCEESMMQGQLELYSAGGAVVLAVHGYSQGDHSGTTERYYFRNGQPIFLYRESGYWQFGGLMQTMDDGTEVPGTIDKITENRFYFHEGQTINALTKQYELRSWEDLDPDSVPNETMAHNGELPESLDFIQSVTTTRTVDCQLAEEL